LHRLVNELSPLESLGAGRLLGEGASSQVWEGRWRERPIVVKVLRPEGNEASFLKEVHIWRQLSHPCICALLGACIYDQRPAIVLEYLGGGSLYNLLHCTPRFTVNPLLADHSHVLGSPRAGRAAVSGTAPRSADSMEVDVAGGIATMRIDDDGAPTELQPSPLRLAAEAALYARITHEVACGLAYLHSCGVMHRDVKACNVLLDGQQHAKLSDFGIATYLVPAVVGSDDDERYALSEYTAETGTYRQMAPEVILHKTYNHKCDVYSYGLLVWETLHHQLPFADATPLQAAFAVAMQNARPVLALSDETRCYAPLITSCWDVEPSDRPDMEVVVETTAQFLHAAESRYAMIAAHVDTSC